MDEGEGLGSEPNSVRRSQPGLRLAPRVPALLTRQLPWHVQKGAKGQQGEAKRKDLTDGLGPWK